MLKEAIFECLHFVHFIQKMAQNHILCSPDLFQPSEKAEICRGTFFCYQNDILKFWRWHFSLKSSGRTVLARFVHLITWPHNLYIQIPFFGDHKMDLSPFFKT